MDLILWRHCDAEDGADDLARRLSPRGRRQAARMATWLRERLPPDCRIVVSPAQRTRETAAALGLAFEVDGDLAPGADVDDVLRATDWPDAPTAVLVVGHQPTLGATASRLLDATPAAFRKGAVWWLRGDARGGATLHAAIAPDD
jgi:phosphohistidine phosphatase